jgi:hypothetical protein
MTSPRLIFNDFFRDPFGGEIKSIGGMSGEGGVLENIQQQVADNGEALQALQGGIGGLPNTPFRNPGDLLDLSTFKPPIAPVQDELRLPTGFEPLPTPSIVDAGKDSQAQLRAEYEKAVAAAKRQRAEGTLGRVVLPGEMSFEEFARMQLKPGSPFDMLGGPMQSDLFNIGQVEQNPGIGLIQDPGISYITGDLFGDINTGPPQTLNETPRSYGVQLQDFGNRGYTGGGTPPVFSDSVNVNQNPTLSMDQLFGRAFAGRPI